YHEPWTTFQFVGYLEKKEGLAKKQLSQILLYSGLSIFYDTPHQLLKTLKLIDLLAGEKEITIARELTKIYETVLSMTAKQWIEHYKNHPLKGEIIVLIKGDGPKLINQTLSTPLQVDFIQTKYGLSKMDAIKVIAEIQGVSKSTIYAEIPHND
ncbi:MAG: 16S rRNA (cytidine(1402)-2'-O)-methyltransferase, partial [Simkaniaceae bacterium]|nr:16S rRNA (cytidine(1402)-2'-O)-methyltransferase [Simkaniaceae bacterium]